MQLNQILSDSYNKTNDVHQYLKIYFRIRTLHVSDGFSVHRHESSTVHTETGICPTGLLTASEHDQDGTLS